MEIISGKTVAEEISAKLEAEVEALSAKGIVPGLAVILVGEDPASTIYVASKEKTCGRLGMRSVKKTLPADAKPAELDEILRQLNEDPSVHGILCQSPLPAGFDENDVIMKIHPEKDVDCFHPLNLGYLCIGAPRFLPCTPFGVIQLLRHAQIPLMGRNVVVLGRSNIVGRPLSIILSLKGYDATVTLCHSRTQDLEAICARADVLVAAVGKPEFVKEDFIKPGAAVIDVGINRVSADNERGYRIVGDVDFKAAEKKAGHITPVPGGVGPLTIQMLMYNTVNAARLQNNLPVFNL